MEKYFNKIIVYLVIGVLFTFVIWGINSGFFTRAKRNTENKTVRLEQPLNPSGQAADSRQNVLILYSKGNGYSEKLTKNLQKVCKWLKMDCETVTASRKDTVSYKDYDMVVIAMQEIETGLGADLERILSYVEQGGKLFWSTMPTELGKNFQAVYRKIGIVDYGDYANITGFSFVEELLPGCKGLSFDGESFYDSSATFLLGDNCKVYMESTGHTLPLAWTAEYGDGKVTMFNFTAVDGDYFTGLLSAGMLTLYEAYMYPVINAKTVFIDDFPSMQYNSESDVIKDVYNRTVKEFYRDIWWPDMQSAAKRYDIAYTGLFMATYDDIVDPEFFKYTKDTMEQYYGDSLLKNNFEMGAHGYNHQSLTLAGGTPESLGYTPWAGMEDMKLSLDKFSEITEELFGDVTIETYVPPSNYLSKEGRAAVVAAFPDLKMISGVYTNEAEEGDVYARDFEIAKDGIAEYPRISSGMLEDSYGDFTMLCGAGLYGAFSHFIHPDDILDAERGGGLEWQNLFQSYCEKLETINDNFSGMRALTATEAADALWIAYYAEPELTITEDKIEGVIYNYYGEVQFYLRSEKHPASASEGCIITPLKDWDNENYYLVQVSSTEFTITLE